LLYTKYLVIVFDLPFLSFSYQNMAVSPVHATRIHLTCHPHAIGLSSPVKELPISALLMGKVLCLIFLWHILLFLLFSVDCDDEGVVHRVVFVDAFAAWRF
jgi:hypothetical protein